VFSYTGALSVKATGFTNVTDVAVDGDDNLYALQMTSNGLLAGPPFTGKLIKIAPDGTKTELAAGQLTFPTGLAIKGSSAYVSDTGFSGTDGRIVKIPLG
jgi:sugar lactone lactonase YvrE